MTDIAKKTLKLGLIGAISALLLATLSTLTEPIIELRRETEMEDVLNSLSGGDKFEAPESVFENGILQRWKMVGGWILEIEAIGYGGPMLLAASYRSDGTVMAARLLDNKETVGFGKKAEDPTYMDIFVGFGGEISIPRDKTELGERADFVSGATITFTGIVTALEKGSEFVKKWENQK